MYEDYYRFTRHPFSVTPDPEFLYKSEAHQAALEQLQRGIRRSEGFFLLTGDVGTGKTTICRTLVQQLGRNVFTALVLNPFVTQEELVRAILQDFGVVTHEEARTGAFAWATKQQLINTLNDFLVSLAQIGASAVVVVDEAQNLSPSLLEGIRLLSNLETDDRKLLQILLVGQPELVTTLEADGMRQLRQRVARRAELRPLTREEVEQYVAYRLRIASGAWGTIFNERALDLVYEFSGGIPRKINLVCDRALEAGFAALAPAINEDLVLKAAELLQLRREARAPPPPRARELPSPWRPRRAWRPRPVAPGATRAVVVAAGVAVGLSVGVGIGVGGVRIGASWLQADVPRPPSPPSRQAALSVPRAVDFGRAILGSTDVAQPEEFTVHAALFPDRDSADATAAMLREFGFRAGIGTASVAGVPVVVGPFTTLDGARVVEEDLQTRLRFRDARIVAARAP